MDLSVHIIDQGNNSQLIAARLKDIGINADLSHDNHYALYNTYRNVFDDFHHISTADAVILDSEVTGNNALKVLYAILKNKPIISATDVHCKSETDSFTEKVIKKARPFIYIKDLSKLDEVSLRRFLSEISKQPTTYHLAPHQIALIRARVRAFFREATSPSIAAKSAR